MPGDYDPYLDAEQLGIEVIHRPIRTANGFWIPDRNLIVIRAGMRAVHDRSSLAHELAHAALGHRNSSPKAEVQADRLACSKLIDLDECREAMKWAPDAHRLAAEMGVSTRLMRVFLNVHRLAA
jgi:Zn-dependent peptidase ImmA (M78 family)